MGSADFCPIRGVDHLEFYVGNAKQAAQFYARTFGFTVTAYQGLETGRRDAASYLLEQGQIRFVLTSALIPEHPAAASVTKHGDGVAVIALEVPDAAQAYAETTRRGARGAEEPRETRDDHGTLYTSAIHIYGDTLIRFVERGDYAGAFAPGFVQVGSGKPTGKGAGLVAVDHIVGNVPLGEMEQWAQFFAETMGFEQLVHFTDENISTEYSALMSKVMMDGTGKIKFPINEPAVGRKGKSQIQEYLEYYGGAGVQHVACLTGDVIASVTRLRDNGVQFLRVPPTYYEELERRVGRVSEPVDKLAELGVLVDRDGSGYLLQLFTAPVADRPTLFYEIIQRRGARGFGEGNFKALFESIEREQALRGNL